MKKREHAWGHVLSYVILLPIGRVKDFLSRNTLPQFRLTVSLTHLYLSVNMDHIQGLPAQAPQASSVKSCCQFS